ncbi:MAG: ABC transporter ATP-binding protein [Eubacteriales bacterium]|nr:ABC transporter ATP-binding protein [Eubacteriales bacterium]
MESDLKNKMFRKNHLNYIVAMFAILVNAVLLVAVAMFLQKVMDIAVSGTTKDIYKMAILGLGYILILDLFMLLERHFRNQFIEKALSQFKEEIFVRISKKRISTFHSESTANYLSALTNDVNSIENNYLQSTFTIVVHAFYFVLALSFMLYYDVKLTICVILLMMLSFVTSAFTGGGLAKAEKNVSLQNEQFTNRIKDLLSGFPVIKSFCAQDAAVTLFSKANDELENQKCKRRKTESLIYIVGNSMGFVVQAGVMLVGAYFALNGRITVGVLIAFVQLMNYIVQPIQQIPQALANRKAALGLIKKIEEATACNVSTGEKISLERSGSGIAYKDVSFGYNEKEQVIEHINLEFQAGKSYAIVGASGSGKSTLVNLLLGGYEQYNGSIQVNGKEIKDVDVESLYEMLAVVWQNVYVFDSSIKDNITMFGDYTEEEIRAAVEKSGLSEFIKEKGLAYQCGENGCMLSGGEKQRISIARCLIRKPDILIMDEGTSALDTETSNDVETSILELNDVTKILITHKLNQEILKKYDNIIVMNEGKIDAVGTYDKLIEQNGYFSRLMVV